MEGTGIYFDPDHPAYVEQAKVGVLPPPFLEFFTEEVPFGADDVVYYVSERAVVRLYDDVENGEADEKVREALFGEFVRAAKEYDNDLGLWVRSYRFTLKKA